MEKTDHVIAGVIPARRGSKRFPGKNQHLLYYSLQAAKESEYLSKTIVTSDDQLVLEAAQWAMTCHIRYRPEAVSNDKATQYAVIMDLLDHGYLHKDDILVLLQPTSPLRTGSDIDGAVHWFLDQCLPKGIESLVSVAKVHEEPTCIVDEEGHFILDKINPGPYYFINGAIYICTMKFLMENRAFYQAGQTERYIMPKYKSIDVDDQEDYKMATLIMEGLQNGK